jgi:small subunit ribosomal protein S16
MATRIRLRRIGRKKQASFRIVVAGGMHARGGRISETIGKYNPRTRPSFIEVDEVRALYWMRQGASLSEGVEPLFRKVGIMKKFAEGSDGEGLAVIGDPQGKTVHPPDPSAKKGKKKDEDKAEAAAPEAAAPEVETAEAAEPETAAPEPEAVEAEAAAPEAETAEPAEPGAAAPEPEAAAPEPEAEEEKQGEES